MKMLDDCVEDGQITAVVLNRERERADEAIGDDHGGDFLRDGTAALLARSYRLTRRVGVLRPNLLKIRHAGLPDFDFHHFTSFSATVHQPRPVVTSAPIWRRCPSAFSFVSSISRCVDSTTFTTL